MRAVDKIKNTMFYFHNFNQKIPEIQTHQTTHSGKRSSNQFLQFK